MDIEFAGHAGQVFARLLHFCQFGDRALEGLGSIVGAVQRHRRHAVAQHAGGDGVPLGMVGIEQVFGRCALGDQREFPAEVHRILHADIEAVPAGRIVDVRGIARQQHPALAIGLGLPRAVVEPRDRGGAVNAVVGPIDRDEPLPDVVERRLAGLAHPVLGEHDPHRTMVLVDDLAVADLVFEPSEPMHAARIVADTPFRLFGQFGLRDQVAYRRVRSRKRDAGGFAHHATPAVAPDEVISAQRPAVADLDIDAGSVLRKAGDREIPQDGYAELLDPAEEYAFDVLLPQPERIGMPTRKIADVQPDAGEPGSLHLLALLEEALGNAALVEDFDRARMQPARPRADDFLVGALLDDHDVDARQRQLGGQHHPRRAATGDHHRMPLR